jgi:broad specificity phosphatase PhoE
MKLYVARHTQTNYNVDRLCNTDASVDVHLTKLGIEQAKQLSERLADIKFDVIYISELPRTKETASYLTQYKKTPVVVDGRLNDNNSGFEGQSLDTYLSKLDDSNDRWNVKFNDGESLYEARQRLESFLKELLTKDYDSVLIVTHAYIIKCISGSINDLDSELVKAFEVTQGDYKVYELS